MSAAVNKGVFLALDAGVRESGWAVFGVESGPVTGVVKTGPRRRLDAHGRVSLLLEHLDRIAERWRPPSVVHSLPSGIRWRIPALELLERSLAQWSEKRGVLLYSYTAQEVRAAIAGHPNATGDQLGYAVMLQLGLIGQSKTTHEWEALAVGQYHLCQGPSGS